MNRKQQPIEAAFSSGETPEGWYARVTFKCLICGRRNAVLLKGLGKMPLPLDIECNDGHKTQVVLYRWNKI